MLPMLLLAHFGMFYETESAEYQQAQDSPCVADGTTLGTDLC